MVTIKGILLSDNALLLINKNPIIRAVLLHKNCPTWCYNNSGRIRASEYNYSQYICKDIIKVTIKGIAIRKVGETSILKETSASSLCYNVDGKYKVIKAEEK